jgi:hypothetical protein
MFSCNKVSTAAFGVINPTTTYVIQFLGPAVFHVSALLRFMGFPFGNCVSPLVGFPANSSRSVIMLFVLESACAYLLETRPALPAKRITL